jgi:hypothetical protein
LVVAFEQLYTPAQKKGKTVRIMSPKQSQQISAKVSKNHDAIETTSIQHP